MPLIAYEGYESGDVERICEIKRNRLQAWREKGWIHSSVHNASNTGDRNIYSIGDCCIISLVKKAVESGLSREAISQFLPVLYENIEALRRKWKEGNEAIYVLFYRVEGSVVSHTIGGFDEGTFSDADDMIGINLTRIISHIEERANQQAEIDNRIDEEENRKTQQMLAEMTHDEAYGPGKKVAKRRRKR